MTDPDWNWGDSSFNNVSQNSARSRSNQQPDYYQQQNESGLVLI